jgi:hypothetical protein
MRKVYTWWKKYVALNTVSLNTKNAALSVIQFSQRDISINVSLVLYILWYWI